MADTDVTVNATGNYVFAIDSDADSTNTFVVDHDSAGVGSKQLLKLEETGVVTMGATGAGDPVMFQTTGAAVTFQNTSSGDVIAFKSDGVVKAKITEEGVGVFADTGAGVVLRMYGLDPDGLYVQEEGVLAGRDYLGDRYLVLKDDAASDTWVSFTMSDIP